MGLFKDLFSKKKKTKEITFGIVEHDGNMTLENIRGGVVIGPDWEKIIEYINVMVSDEQEYVILTLPEPVNGIRYMQAARIKNGIDVEAGIEEGSNTRLVQKTCNQEMTLRYFKDFYENGNVRDIEKFTPVRFV